MPLRKVPEELTKRRHFRVELGPDLGPSQVRVLDVATGEDVTANVWKIEILPLGRALVELWSLHDGEPYIDETQNQASEIHVVDKIEGAWDWGHGKIGPTQ